MSTQPTIRRTAHQAMPIELSPSDTEQVSGGPSAFFCSAARLSACRLPKLHRPRQRRQEANHAPGG